MEQADYRSNPSLAHEVHQEPVDRDHPYPEPWQAVSPGPDEELVNYDLPHEPHTYNQMSLGIPAPIQGWSQDSYAAAHPDVNPRR